MATFNGSSLLIKVDSTAVAHTTTASLTMDAATIDVSSKDSGGDAEFIAGQKSATLDFEGLTDFAATGYGLDDLFTIWYNREEIAWEFETSGNTGFSGVGYITSLTLDAPMEDVSTFSGTIQVTAGITFTA